MRAPSQIVLQNNLAEYFKELVIGALRNQNLDTHEMAEFYLVNLLAEFHKNNQIAARCPITGEEEPWAITYLRAAHLNRQEKLSVLKGLGDRSLYLSGVFSQHLESSSVGLNYYMSLGGTAYKHVAHLMGAANSELEGLFQELAINFSAFVDILSEVSESAGIQKDTDLLRMVDRWIETGSQRAEKFLIKSGVSLPDAKKKDILQ